MGRFGNYDNIETSITWEEYLKPICAGENPPKWPISYAGFDSWQDLENAYGDFNLTKEERKAYEDHKRKYP